jgi:hypothetical protein
MFYLSDRIFGSGSGGGLFAAHSTFLNNLNRPSKIIIASLLCVVLAFFILWVSPSAGSKFVKSSAGFGGQGSNAPETDKAAVTRPEDRSQNYVSPVSNSTSTSNAGNSQEFSNNATVNINGQSVSTSTDNTHPSASVNKTIKTAGGEANVSIQSNVNNNAQTGQASSSQSVQFNSNVRGMRDSHINIEQNSSSGGSMP